jgi:aryl-alcohol dehydrogenase-like predicted oxidoreductase
MEYRTLGQSGAVASVYALGTMNFGSETAESVAFEQLDRFVEAGGTLIDTANVYSRGASEEIIGRWIASRPRDVTDRLVVATKGRYSRSDDPNALGASRRSLGRALDTSLRRLGLDTIDLYQVHGWDPLTPLEETLSFLDDAVLMGKIRYCGFSNFTGWQVQKAADLAYFRNLSRPVTLQPQYNLLTREPEWEIVPAAQENGLGLLAWSPLSGGLLTGKYRQGERPAADTRIGEAIRIDLAMYDALARRQRTWDTIAAVGDIAEQRGCSSAQVALAWVAARPGVTSVILGARTVQQLEDNLGAVQVDLTGAELERLNAVSDPAPAQYPYGPYGVRQRSRVIASH